MLIGKVIGTVIATKKDPELEGLRLLLIKGAVPGPSGQLVLVRSAARTLPERGGEA